MNLELLSIVLGSTFAGAAIGPLVQGIIDWASGRAKKKREAEQRLADDVEKYKESYREALEENYHAITAFYAALRELDKLGAPCEVRDKLEKLAHGHSEEE
ncbi:hypothetical protein QP786_00180 [Gleimia europaea]|nr:hypothetical protein [Gleimia europaea]MDK8534430.1 hypothetical protein [Gleimia europaea]